MLANKIMSLYPNAVPMVDFNVRDDSDGRGPYIEKWNTQKLGTIPTKEALAAADGSERIDPDKSPLDTLLAKDPDTWTATELRQIVARLARRERRRM